MPRTLSKHYGRYSNEFKRLAVLLTHHPDILATDVAGQLGIHPVMLYRWRMEMKNGEIPDRADPGDVHSEIDLLKAMEENKRLRKELAEVKMERDFLKKAKRFSQHRKPKSINS